MAPSHAVNAPSVRCKTLSCDRPWRVDDTIVAGKWRGLLMAGDDDEMYDKKPQRYAEDNRTAFKLYAVVNLKPK